jgi:hypothetical protein
LLLLLLDSLPYLVRRASVKHRAKCLHGLQSLCESERILTSVHGRMYAWLALLLVPSRPPSRWAWISLKPWWTLPLSPHSSLSRTLSLSPDSISLPPPSSSHSPVFPLSRASLLPSLPGFLLKKKGHGIGVGQERRVPWRMTRYGLCKGLTYMCDSGDRQGKGTHHQVQ